MIINPKCLSNNKTERLRWCESHIFK